MPPPTNSDQLHGTLDMLVLKVLEDGPLHGYAIAVRLERLSKRRPQRRGGIPLSRAVPDGAARMARLHVGRDRHRPAGAVLQADEEGRAQLEAETASWLRLTTAVADVLNG